MINLSISISGGELASNMSDDMEESSYFFIHFVEVLSNGDWEELEENLKDNSNKEERAKLKRLGELLIRVSE